MIILDTDAITFLLREAGTNPLRAYVTQLSVEHDVVTTIVTYEEQTRGWLSYAAKSRTPAAVVQAYDRLITHLDDYRSMNVLPFDQAASDMFILLRKSYPHLGTLDLRIAAIALVRGATLLSRNRRHFGQIAELRLDDWSHVV